MYERQAITQVKKLEEEPPFAVKLNGRKRKSGGTEAHNHGLRYERKAQSFLSAVLGSDYIPSPWFQYETEDAKPRFCQPDGLYFDQTRQLLIVVEIKLGHCKRAWKQLRNLYEPIVKEHYGTEWHYAVCEVVSSFDPQVRLPEEVKWVSEIGQVEEGEFAVLVARERHLNGYS